MLKPFVVEEIEDINKKPSETACNFINIPLGSVFVKKYSHKSKIQKSVTEETDCPSNNEITETQLSKFKHYSRILESSNTLTKFPLRENHPLKSDEENCPEQHETETLRKLNDQSSKEIDVVQNYYASKNERKNKVLNKAKELGKNNFYKFLKETAILENNRHFHRFHDQTKVTRKGSPPQQGELSSENEEISPIIFSFKQRKDENIFSKMKNKFEHPELISIRELKKKLRLNTEATEYRSLGITTQNSEVDLKSPEKLRNNKKGIIRSLTEINEQIKKNRSSKHKEHLLFRDEEAEKMENLQNFVEKWKYKSLLSSEPQSLYYEHSGIKKPINIFKQELNELRKPKKSLFFLNEKETESRGYSQIIKNTSLKKSIPKKEIVENFTFNIKSLMPEIRQK